MKHIFFLISFIILSTIGLHGQLTVPGMNTSSGDNEFGNYSHVSIYGQNSILRSSKPRILLEGIEIIESVFSNNYLINSNNYEGFLPFEPSFISSINILKSKYAVGGLENEGNGIIYINVSEGSQGSKKTIFKSSYSINQAENLPDGIANEQKDIMNNGYSFKNALLISRGRSKLKYCIMAANTLNESFIPGKSSKTNNAGFNTSFKIANGFSAKADIYWTNTETDALPRFSGNTGLLYNMQNSTTQQTEEIIHSSNSNYSQHLVLPSLELKFDFDWLIAKYHANGNIRQNERKDTFDSIPTIFGDGFLSFEKNNLQSITHGPSANFKKDLGDHNFSLYSSYNFTTTEEEQDINQLSSGINTIDTTYQEKYNKNTIFGRLDYNYGNTLLFSIGYNQINNNLFTDFKPVNHYSVAAGLNYSELNWFNRVGFLNSGKISFGYDYIENTPPLFLAPVLLSANDLIPASLLYANKLNKAEFTLGIKPEIKQMFTMLYDFSLFEGSLSLNLEFYQSTTKNLFVPVDLQNNLVGNDGEIISKGLNAHLSYRHQTDWGLNMNHYFIYSMNQSMVQNLANDSITLAGIGNVKSYAINDQPYGLLIDNNGTIANPFPDFNLFYKGNFDWKGFDLSIICQWKQGGETWNAHQQTFEDASYFRINKLIFGYSSRMNFIRKIDNLRISLFAKNLLTSTKYSGATPDTHFFGQTNTIGIDYYNMPAIKSYGISLNIDF